MNRPFHRPDAVKIVEIVAVIPLTSRKAVQVSIVEQNGVRMGEVRHVGLAPDGRTVEARHSQRTTIRSKAIARAVEALASVAVRLEGGQS